MIWDELYTLGKVFYQKNETITLLLWLPFVSWPEDPM